MSEAHKKYFLKVPLNLPSPDLEELSKNLPGIYILLWRPKWWWNGSTLVS